MNNIFVLNKNYKKIGTLSNQGANPQAPYFNDLYTQELDTGADTYQFSTMSTPYTQDLLEIGNHIMFTYKNRNELFTITSLEYSHNEGYKTIGVYAEGVGFDLLEIYMKRPANEKENNGSNSSGSGNSGSGNSGSSGGNDSDGDGDDNTDDEYADPDDVYIDENGNIIYDKYGQDDYADQDNVTIDENGNIIYRRSKNNRKNDSLEFKNISYSRFLSILLKGTGWSYVCQPGLESVKYDISVRYDRNIYAVLQDSMQSYRGVELEFIHEYNGGQVTKTVKAYKDGGRGSFVGKRFEYGKNVRGITKTQEVTDSKDDTILYIDNVGVDVYYDIDFALKSAEVPEIEIGDTHYVIDKDFCPPMTIKARIGKIEVSFSDPTRNKIYLANNKKISGSAIEDEFDKDSISDIVDDRFDDIYGDDDHTHYELVNLTSSDTVGFYDSSFTTWKDCEYDLGDSLYRWRNLYTCGAFALTVNCDQIKFSDGTVQTTASTGGNSGGGGGSTPEVIDTLVKDFQVGRTLRIGHYKGDQCNLPLFKSLDWDGATGTIEVVKHDSRMDACDNMTRITAGYIMTDKIEAEEINVPGILTGVDFICHNLVVINNATGDFSGSSDKSLKENIRYIDAPTTYSNEDLLEKADLYDFIVNQLNICEYNFIDDDRVKIGFIANDYEGTKVGDKIVSRNGKDETFVYNINNLLFVIIGALQEEARIKDEKIAGLEDRLAKIEALLGIDN